MAIQTLTQIRDNIKTAFTGAGFRFLEGDESDMNNFFDGSYPSCLMVLVSSKQDNEGRGFADHKYILYVGDTLDQSEMTEVVTNSQEFWTAKHDSMTIIIHTAFDTLFADVDMIYVDHEFNYLKELYADKLAVIPVDLTIKAHFYCLPL